MEKGAFVYVFRLNLRETIPEDNEIILKENEMYGCIRNTGVHVNSKRMKVTMISNV